MPKNKEKRCLAILSACLVFMQSCDAPRHNPFDPYNSHSPLVTLSGVVTDTDAKRPIVGALVLWPSQNRMSLTDVNGRFALGSLLPQGGQLIVQKNGFISDTSWVDLRSDLELEVALRPVPVLTGRVMRTRVPPLPIEEVKVTWLPGNQYTFTTAGGYFTFENPRPGMGTLLFEKSGYKTLAVETEWRGVEMVTHNVFLNALPTVSGYKICSTVENNYGPRRIYQMTVEARVTDDENDIDSVYVACSALGIKKPLAYDVLDKKFFRTFSPADLKLTSLHQAVGHEFVLHVVDTAGDDFTLGTQRLVRVIADEIEISSPKNSESVSLPFTVTWLPFSPGFPFTYTLQIFTDDDFTPELAWQKEAVHADSLSAKVNANLAPGEYVWMIWCVDEFGNRSRSKPGSFEIIEAP